MKKLFTLLLSFGLVAGMMLPLVGCTSSTTKSTTTPPAKEAPAKDTPPPPK
jgi:hypothetical protein